MPEPSLLSSLSVAVLLGRQAYEWWRNMHLSRDEILKADDIKTEVVEVPEWGGTVLVRGLTGRERDSFEASIMERRGKQLVPNVANVRAKLACRCIIDENGRRVFSDQDADELGEKNASAMNRVYDVASRLSGMTDDDLEELVENFDGTPSGGSSLPSRRTSAKRSGSSSVS